MKDKIQMTEDQAKDIYNECVMVATGTEWHNFIEDMRDSGYIKKSDLEIARENYNYSIKYLKDAVGCGIAKQEYDNVVSFVCELVKEIERLKNE